MRSFLRFLFAALVCLAVAGAGISLLIRINRGERPEAVAPMPGPSPAVALSKPYPSPDLVTFPDPTAPPGSSAQVFLDPQTFDGFIPVVTGQFTDKVRDEGSLHEYREAISHRAERARAQLLERNARLRLGPQPTLDQALQAIPLYTQVAFVALYEGDHDEAATWLKKALALSSTPGVPASVRAHVTALLGINALRRGEQDNCIGCVGPSSCIFPIAREAVHTRPAGSREAVGWFTAYLEEWPGDLRVRWLLNIASMTLGEYPDKVPPRYRIPVAPFRSKQDLGRFENIAIRVGLIARGPDLAGGCIFDDFTGDGRPDLFTSSFDVVHGASLYVNDGKGGFEDRSRQAGLDEQVYALNVTRADYDNDGRLDVLLLRGAWEKPAPMSLLRNKGDGVFEDVTVEERPGQPDLHRVGRLGRLRQRRPARPVRLRRVPALAVSRFGRSLVACRGPPESLPALSQPGERHVRRCRREGRRAERAVRQGLGLGRLRQRWLDGPARVEHGRSGAALP